MLLELVAVGGRQRAAVDGLEFLDDGLRLAGEWRLALEAVEDNAFEKIAKRQVGVFGQLREPDALLKCGDRVEIYRPLVMDAKSARRYRAELQSGA